MEIDLLQNFKVACSRALGDSGGSLEVYMPVHRPDLFSFLTNRSFSHDVTAAIFVYKTMNRRPCLCTKKILWELNSFHMLKLSFIPSNLQSC